MSPSSKVNFKKKSLVSMGSDRAEVTNFLNREFQWLEFNKRVLHQAMDPKIPLLERVKFLLIFNSNLDEFIMKRLGGLKKHIRYGLSKKSLDGQTAKEQLHGIGQRVKVLLSQSAKVYKENIVPGLRENGIILKKWKELKSKEKKTMVRYYESHIFPILTPLVVDTALPFPFISNLSLSLAIKLEKKKSGDTLFGRLKVPGVFPHWLLLDSDENSLVYVSLLEVIIENLENLFPDTKILKVMPFRVTRNVDLDPDEEGAEDLLEVVTEELRQRRFAEAVRLEVSGKDCDSWMLDFLKKELDLDDEDVYFVSGFFNSSGLKEILDLPLPDIKYKPWSPQIPPLLQEAHSCIFDIIKKKDILVHHPFESFSASVERLIYSAVDDPNVLGIKMTLYRTDKESSIISSLIKAAERGKQVVCLVELKARFDEERNIFWAQQMEKAGVHVVYGVVGFKTHCKTTLILRKEDKEIRAYAHIGTGNYNSLTARFYTDLGLMTSCKKITDDVVQLFHFLTGRSFKREFSSILVAPTNMKFRFIELIKREIAWAQKGEPSHIMAKFNGLEDPDICHLLYEASEKGCKVELIVRGICCLRPQVKGLSENIRVVSIVDRFLEHSRIFFFRNGQKNPLEGDFFIGSADWMKRNLKDRVEVITPVWDPGLRERCYKILNLALQDPKQAWELLSDGSYRKRKGQGSSSQEELMKLAKGGKAF